MRGHKQKEIKQKGIKNVDDQLIPTCPDDTSSLTEQLCPKYRKVKNLEQVLFQHESQATHPPKSKIFRQIVLAHPAKSNQTEGNQGKSDIPKPINQNQSVSVIHLNQSIGLPAIIDKKLSINSLNLTKNSSMITEVESQSPTLSIKLRNKLSKGRHQQSKLSEQQLRQSIRGHFEQLNCMIENTSNYFDDRMKTHQNQLIKIMIVQIKRIHQDCQNTIMKYNQLIKQKKNQVELKQAHSQINYYKNQVIELNKQTESLKKQIKYLKRLNSEFEMKIQTDSQVLIKISKKLMAEKQKNRHITKSVIVSMAPQMKRTQLSSGKQLRLHTIDKTQTKAVQMSSANEINAENACLSTQKLNKRRNISLIQQNLQTEAATNLSSQQSLKQFTMKELNRKLDSKYRLNVKVTQFNSEKNKYSYFHNIENDQQNQPNESQGNRDKIVNFLKQSRPSIKSIIMQKKQKAKDSLKKTVDQTGTEHFTSKIKIIKTRVQMSSFDQQRWQLQKSHSIDDGIQQFKPFPA